jgi:hypothetical protein
MGEIVTSGPDAKLRPGHHTSDHETVCVGPGGTGCVGKFNRVDLRRPLSVTLLLILISGEEFVERGQQVSSYLRYSLGYSVYDIGTNLSNVRSSHSIDRSGPDSFTIWGR